MIEVAPAVVPREQGPACAANERRGGGLLPATAFESPAFQRREDAAIWARSWVAVGFAAEVAQVGDVLPFTVGNHGIHVEKRADGSLSGRFNKAQHGGCRAVPLQCQTGAKTRCSFTACGYSHDRRPIAAADPDRDRILDQYLGLRPERLLKVDVRLWGPLLLVRIDPQAEATLDWPMADIVLPPGGFDQGATAWSECAANWKQAVAALACADDLSGRASVLYPNVVVRASGQDTCIILVQPVAPRRTLCRIRTWSGHCAEVASAWIADWAARQEPTGLQTARSNTCDAFERRILADMDWLASEERSDVLFNTNDKGEW